MKPIAAVAAVLLSGVAQASFPADASLSGPASWGETPPRIAVVNSVCARPSDDLISLRGEWDFITANSQYHRSGHCGNRFQECSDGWADAWPGTINTNDLRKMPVPGFWEAQGVGMPGPSETWSSKWDHDLRDLRNVFRGEGWYRRYVDIPKSWKGKRIWLKIGGVMSQGWFWVNNRQVAWSDTYCGTYKYEITGMAIPGERAKIDMEISNAKTTRKGCFAITHHWGGVWRDIEIEATPQTFIDEAWVRGDFDGRKASVNVEIEDAVQGCVLRSTIEGRSAQMPLDSGVLAYKLEVPLSPFRPWSPECPNLYTAKVELVSADGVVLQTRYERFGVRKFEVRGKSFFLNGKPFFVRGAGFHCLEPIYGIAPADRAYHLSHIRKVREAGFNFVRLHTRCEAPEFFEAADEAGLMVQAELPYYADHPADGQRFDPAGDALELYRHFRRHPSFAVYSGGNEGSFGPVLAKRIYEMIKRLDPDRLTIEQDSWSARSESSDFTIGPHKEWRSGKWKSDRPFVCHEYLNMTVKFDSRLDKYFTGAWLPPARHADRLEWLRRFGLDSRWSDRLQFAQHALQRTLHKRGIETARKDPACGGYDFWSLQDCCNVQKGVVAAQGLFDVLWGDKNGGSTAAEFALFNSPSCVLADFGEVVRTSGEQLDVKVQLARFETSAAGDGRLELRLSDSGESLFSREVPLRDVIPGAVREIAHLSFGLPDVERPRKLRVEALVEIGEDKIRNGWDLWLFPKRQVRDGSFIAVEDGMLSSLSERFSGLLPESKLEQASLVIAAPGSSLATKAGELGKNLITVTGADGKSNCELGWWTMGRQVGTAIADHPVLGDFPHEGYLSPLMFRILKEGTDLSVASGVASEDYAIVGEGRDSCYLYLAAGRGKGGCGYVAFSGIDVLSDTPEGAALLDEAISYLAGNAARVRAR